MNQVMIIQGARYSLVSYGNGLAYALTPKGQTNDGGIFLQGEDAGTFREELDELERRYPHWHVDDVLHRLMDSWRPY